MSRTSLVGVSRAPFGRFTTLLTVRPEDRTRDFIPVDAPVALPYGRPRATIGEGDIFGEMTCMSHYPRSATVRAAEDCTVLEMLRNVLYVMQRSPSFRRDLEAKYRARAIDGHLRNVPLFAPLRDDEAAFRQIVDELRPRVSMRRCEPGEVIFRQGAPAVDGLYLIRTGFVKVSQSRPGGERVLNYVGPSGYIGEIGLLSGLPELRDLAPAGVRTATCTALDHVDLVRISAADFRAILDRSPAVRAAVIAEARARLLSNQQDLRDVREAPLESFLDQGLQEAKNLLVLDLTKCTRCDECTKACADTHQGVTRLIREGLRFDRFLVASSCRSCLDPYCMVGCPVGSIRRHKSNEIHHRELVHRLRALRRELSIWQHQHDRAVRQIRESQRTQSDHVRPLHQSRPQLRAELRVRLPARRRPSHDGPQAARPGSGQEPGIGYGEATSIRSNARLATPDRSAWSLYPALGKSRIIITSSVAILLAGRCPMTVGRIRNPSRNHSVPGPFPSAGRLSITLNTDHDVVIFAGFPSKSEREPAVGEESSQVRIPAVGVEPTRGYPQRILNPQRLPWVRH